MTLPDTGRDAWTKVERQVLERLDRPERVQQFLDGITYNDDKQCRSPRRVLRDRRAHCMEGAMFAAAALRYHGFGCRLLDMLAVRDDDHVIALFQEHGCWGAVAKSNFTGLRFREPVYRSLRELVMSYFESYFNVVQEKTLRGYSRPVDLSHFDAIGWRTTEADLDQPIGSYLTARPHIPLLTKAMIRSLGNTDARSFEAAMVGCNPAGLYQVT